MASPTPQKATSGAEEMITFDKAFGRMPGVRRLK